MGKFRLTLDLQTFAATRIADVIVPEVFNPYLIERTAELSALVQAGIIVPDPQLDELAATGGTILNMPFWSDLEGESEILSDTDPLEVNSIKAKKDMARLHTRGKAWGANDLAKALSGDDPMRAIADLVAAWWNRDRQRMLFSTLKGVFASPSMEGNLHDISGNSGSAGVISAVTIVDAQQKLGDAANKLTAFSMHSAVFSKLLKDQLIEWQKDPVSGVEIPYYLGKRVVVDDGHPVDNNGVYTSYLFGQGAIGFGNGAAPVPTETDRDSLQGDDILINRQHFILHPRGVKWNEEEVTGVSPTNAELENPDNWERVYENKNIRIVEFKHRIA
ncbi:coat protein [Xylanibacillus composti]|uniref:Coat protein n=1 Tax=Xylanibacillus composti TaxID=1572762 RepID=A0A8J4H4L4_9BACL|nr:major capsid protein [Xylanibacillus composti]MDT9723775.1 coat protein [Xylanibacillus composti]GIQ70754.1 coat protein [Xylanibacillus composti]